MSRLADEILQNDVTFHLPAWWSPRVVTPEIQRMIADDTEGSLKFIRDYLRTSQVIVLDNIAEYFFAESGQETWDAKKDFPNVAPPFRNYWMEYRRPSRIYSDQIGENSSEQLPRAVGIAYDALDMLEEREDIHAKYSDPEFVQRALKKLQAEFLVNYNRYGDGIREKLAEHGGNWELVLPLLTAPERATVERRHLCDQVERYLDDGDLSPLVDGIEKTMAGGVRWQVRAVMYSRQKHGVAGPLASWEYHVSPEGKFVRWLDYALSAAEYSDAPTQQMVDALFCFIHPTLLATSLLHCKNVKIQEVAAPAKLQQARQKRSKRPLVTYKVLEIEPFKQEVRQKRSRSGQPATLKQALHVCRGHFKHFGAAAVHGGEHDTGKLFGRHEGTYWWSDRLKGKKNEGTVEKVYRVEKPVRRTLNTVQEGA